MDSLIFCIVAIHSFRVVRYTNQQFDWWCSDADVPGANCPLSLFALAQGGTAFWCFAFWGLIHAWETYRITGKYSKKRDFTGVRRNAEFHCDQTLCHSVCKPKCFKCNLRMKHRTSFREATCLWSLQTIWICTGHTLSGYCLPSWRYLFHASL